ncbi:hypothetical protein [Natrinema amylolyticum]|uniref:hypothetical protein n=1 Tax=Natrinema amylolyticum TaxID=2878679 RepID=UPI001CFA106D|nr:hypothetical protein [Natrinema amylolyticum]
MSAIPHSPEEAREFLGKLKDRVDHLFEDIVDLEATTEDHEERIAELEAENEQLRERVDELEAIAEQAMVVASAGHDPDGESKVERAKRLTRNELVRRAAMGGPARDRPITTTQVREMARPETELKWQTVKDGWADLGEEWPCFRETTKDGTQALTVSRSDISKSLARAVEANLERDDLAKRLVGDNRAGGDQG